MEFIVLLLAIIVAVKIAFIEALQFAPSSLSQAELERRAAAGDKLARRELKQRQLLPLYYGLQRLVVTVLVVLLIGLLVAVFPVWLGLLLGFGLMLLVAVVSALGILQGMVNAMRPKIERHIWKVVKTLAPILKLLAPRAAWANGPSIASKDELKQLIDQDATVLAADEKSRLLAAIHFSTKTTTAAMVRRDKIATVDAGETVGPLLLDTLHKVGHNIFVVVKKDLNHVMGLLYMADLVPLDPDVKKVKDAVRPRVFYIPADAPLQNVLAASLKTGRQLFLVANKQGEVVGLVTLADALEHLLGSRLGNQAAVAPDAKTL